MQNSPTPTFISEGGVASPQGFKVGAARAGLKTQGDDVILIVSEAPATSAAVFTRNRIKAAPVLLSAQNLQNDVTRAVVANAGNANCCTGEQGARAALRMCEIIAEEFSLASYKEVLVCSTGIIGHQLDMDKVEPALRQLSALAAGQAPDGLNEKAARSFMTTDTRPKYFAAQAEIDGKTVTVGGQSKGAGMIAPDMAALHATMLAFLTTDAGVEKALLQRALEHVIERSFNSVTIDGDTSTNDTALILANGASGVQITEENLDQFVALLEKVSIALAREIARDGEGATKLVTIEVEGAETEADAKKIALSVANSPLVKTAIFGGDPNWGRIACAAGYAGVEFAASSLCVSLGEVEVFRNGEPTNFSTAAAEAALKPDELTIRIVVGTGPANWRAWTCDYSYDYIRINAEYHT